MARAMPRFAITAKRVAPTLESLALVATTASVVFCRPQSRWAPSFMAASVSANSMLLGARRAPAINWPVSGSRTSPKQLTATRADTCTESVRPTVTEPMPLFMACGMPKILPTVAPVPTPRAPDLTASEVAAADAASPISRVGRTLGLPMPKSYRMAHGTMGTTAAPV